MSFDLRLITRVTKTRRYMFVSHSRVLVNMPITSDMTVSSSYHCMCVALGGMIYTQFIQKRSYSQKIYVGLWHNYRRIFWNDFILQISFGNIVFLLLF